MLAGRHVLFCFLCVFYLMSIMDRMITTPTAPNFYVEIPTSQCGDEGPKEIIKVK